MLSGGAEMPNTKYEQMKDMRSTVLRIMFAIPYVYGTITWGAGPTLSREQIQSAIHEGRRYKTADQYLEKGMKGKRVKFAGAMAIDGTSKYATFFDDWQAVAAEAAAANQQLRELKPDEIQSGGLLHAFVEIHARGASGTGKLDRRYGNGRAHLVLKMGDRIIQPIDKDMIYRSGQSLAMFALGAKSGKITLAFAFDVSPEDLRSPIEVILVDGDGNRHSQTVDLDGVFRQP